MKINDLALLMYTNETYLPISKLSIDEFNKYSSDFEIKKYLVSNKITDDLDLTNSDFEIFDAKIPLSTESHQFADVLIYALEKINEKFVIFWLEDTFVGTKIKGDNLNSVVKLLDENKISHLSLMSYGHNWDVLKLDYSKFNLPEDLLFDMPNSYVFTFSVQPAIWETKVLLDVLRHNRGISLHEFDSSNIKNKKGERRSGDDGNGYINTPDGFWDYGIKHSCFKRTYETTPYCFDDRPFEGDYFLFLYSGAIRNGKFDFNTHNNSREFIKKFLHEKNIDKDHEIYGKYF